MFSDSASSTVSSPSSWSLSNEKETATNFVEYGPIRVRLTRKPAPTLATGRQSKYIKLSGDAAIKRDKRREKNRIAARRLKEKRELIEDELQRQIEVLENEHFDLQKYLVHLQSQKQRLETELNNSLFFDSITELLMTDDQKLLHIFDDYTDCRHLLNVSSFSNQFDFDMITGDPSGYC